MIGMWWFNVSLSYMHDGSSGLTAVKEMADSLLAARFADTVVKN
jgi:hypothetical protein